MHFRYVVGVSQRLITRRYYTLESTHGITSGDIGDTFDSSKKRTKVAIFFGYVGTNYRGLQIQSSKRTGTTIEYHLRNALFRSGCIHPKNFDNMHRIKWNRSSRTDAGVHALSIVVSARLLLSPAIVEDLTKGKGGSPLVNKINEYLPNDIRVFGFSKVPRQWRARQFCNERTYRYYLSPHALGMSASGTEPDDFQKLEMFRSVLSMFEGRRPFHNFVRKSSNYSHYKKQLLKGPLIDTYTYEDEEEFENDDDSIQTHLFQKNEYALWVKDHNSLHPRYHIGGSHFRFIRNFTCDDIRPLSLSSKTKDFSKKCAPPVLVVSVTGNSFMLNQIRHMIGTAIAVVNKKFPIELIQPALLLPLRLKNVPLSPAEPLVLSGCSFVKRFDPDGKLNKLANAMYSTGKDGNTSILDKHDDDPDLSYESCSCVLSNKKQFQSVIERHLYQYIQPEFWDEWLESSLSLDLPTKNQLLEIYEQSKDWIIERRRIREERYNALRKDISSKRTKLKNVIDS